MEAGHITAEKKTGVDKKYISVKELSTYNI